MNDNTNTNGNLFLGLDSSTQGVKGTLIDAEFGVVLEDAVNFDSDLPEFETEGGVHRHADGLTITSPPIMWVAAIDILFEKLKAAGCPFSSVVAVSGSGQQHGSVWLKSSAVDALAGLDSGLALRDQLADVFSVADSPIWMDASTQSQCDEREAALGGPQAVADLTGSRAYVRFTGNQIAKIYQKDPEAYGQTDRVALVSSFVAALLAGKYAPIDTSDGSGMNLMDIRTREWSPEALACTAPELAAKLGPIAPGHKTVGKIHSYFTEKYGFSPECTVIAFSGDNPNSLAGLRLQSAGDVAISLGTSDTMFGYLLDPKPSGVEGHIFANPVDPEAYMVMLCHMNGSLARERVRDSAAGGSWDAFGEAIANTPAGNDGRVGIFFFEPEISPPTANTGTFFFDRNGDSIDNLTPESEARAVVESQFMSMRSHGCGIGLEPSNILATGGASANAAILKVMSDVFGVPVYTGEQTASASLGAAYRAMHGWTCRVKGQFVPFAEVMSGAPSFSKAVDPDPAAHEVYSSMLPRFSELEQRVAG